MATVKLPLQSQWIETARRLGELQLMVACANHVTEAPVSGYREDKWLSIYSNCDTGEIFVEVSDDQTTRVQSFFSRHKNCPPVERRKDLPLVDIADAHALARFMLRRWPRISLKK